MSIKRSLQGSRVFQRDLWSHDTGHVRKGPGPEHCLTVVTQASCCVWRELLPRVATTSTNTRPSRILWNTRVLL
jgi:hypothetical protein